jgi:tripartite-type tricarboxylate transporter receptor subunit TctC
VSKWKAGSLVLTAGCAVLTVSIAIAAEINSYPRKAVRLVVPFPPGGSSDHLARLFAQRFSGELHQQFIVDDRPGAGTTIGATLAARAEPDGYTLLLTSISVTGIAPHVMKVSFDPVKDFAPIAMFGETFSVLAVNPSLPVRTVAELIALAKAKPGELNFGSAGNGSMTHLWGELFKVQTGVNMVHVPFAGSTASVIDLIAGRMQLNFDPNSIPYVQSGKLRGLAVIGAKRCPTIPDVPTMAEAGMPDFKAGLWYGLAAPRGTPREIVVLLNRMVNKAMADRLMVERMQSFGIEPMPLTTAKFAQRIDQDYETFGKIVRMAGLKLD